jgi:DNA-binding MarR family transcriptional regulator
VAATLRSLEADDLVVRRPHPEDGRKALVSLTSGGAKLIAEARRGKHAWLQRAMSDALAVEEQQLLLRAGDLMQRLADHRDVGSLHLTDDEIHALQEPYTPHGPSWF